MCSRHVETLHFGSRKCDLSYFFFYIIVECHTFNMIFFSAPANMAHVHLFCFTAFFKFTFSKNFLCEIDF